MSCFIFPKSLRRQIYKIFQSRGISEKIRESTGDIQTMYNFDTFPANNTPIAEAPRRRLYNSTASCTRERCWNWGWRQEPSSSWGMENEKSLLVGEKREGPSASGQSGPAGVDKKPCSSHYTNTYALVTSGRTLCHSYLVPSLPTSDCLQQQPHIHTIPHDRRLIAESFGKSIAKPNPPPISPSGTTANT